LKEIAILGPTASGKTSLSINLAKQYNANILSLDSLSIYKQIDIASAKPTYKQRAGIKHFGVDVLHVDDIFNVTLFFDLYKQAKKQSELEKKNLIIVGGTGFYLKSMIDGISYKPDITPECKSMVKDALKDLKKAYKIISDIDNQATQIIKSNDRYRIEKWLEIYFQTKTIPSVYFEDNKKKPVLKNIQLYEIEIQKEFLRGQIEKRTETMLKDGLIDEVVCLEKKYTRLPNPMRAIGIKETLDFLDGNLDKNELKEKIIINTAKLAKRQKTFNKTQLQEHLYGSSKELHVEISNYFER